MPSVRKFLLACLKDRRRAQAGTTLIELLVSLTIAALSLSLIVGTLSTGLLDATLAKRNTAAQAVIQYEMEQVSSSTFSSSTPPYSDCFATEQAINPKSSPYQVSCPAGYSLRADVSWQPYSGTVQMWTIAVSAASGASTGASVQIYKVAHQ
jgi:type II secretory pathway pseudopilin PulG